MTTISDLLQAFRDASSNTTTQGRYFEKLCREWLLYSGVYPEIARVDLWNDWPRRGNVADIGIDLVAETETGEFYGIQCKFFTEGSSVSKDQIDSFLAASGKSYGGASFSKLLIMTTAPLGANAHKTIEGHIPECSVIRVDQFDDASFDWTRIVEGFRRDARLDLEGSARPRKEPRPHQVEAIAAVKRGFESVDRGKLIMACGTGKTFTSLRIVEEVAPEGGVVLYLVPSLMLLSQTLNEWSRESRRRLAPIVVCSDAQIHEQDARVSEALGKKAKKSPEAEDDAPTFDATELTRPATTKPEVVVQRWHEIESSTARRASGDRPTVVVFSTYQSIETVSEAQKAGFPQFDLTICDEAHRTTGANLAGKKGYDESAFVRVHDADFIRSAKRLYMTATPRVYGEVAQAKAKEKNVVLCSMDDANLYGVEFYKLSFGDAVEKGLLSDYKVLVLSVTEEYAQKYVGLCKTTTEVAASDGLRKEVDETDLDVDDVAKMIGCWRGLAKISKFRETQESFAVDPEPMKRAVAFCKSIQASKEFAKAFKIVGAELARETDEQNGVDGDEPEYAEGSAADGAETPRIAPRLETEHVDGTFNADQRAERLNWLKGETRHACRVLSNVRCLSEGVDVPNLDAAIFVAPRNSEVDVIQAVGRVMRRAPGKKLGYIILPVVVTEDVEPDIALNNNERYKVIWQTLNALRSHDERFRIMINQIQVGEKSDVITVDPPPEPEGGEGPEPSEGGGDDRPVQTKLPGFGEALRKGIYAQIVKRCGDRHYLDDWAKSVARIASSRIDQIRKRLENPTAVQRAAFSEFLGTLQKDVNGNLDEQDAIDMLTQHMTTLPVFNALFAENAFSRKNPVVCALEKVVSAFNVSLSREDEELERQFQADVKSQIDGVRTSEGRQQVVHTLYEQFFTQALPKTAEKLGVVYTPPEVVDYILRSVAYVLRKEFNNRSISRDGVHILDPFTGTGAFISRLLLSGLIRKEDLKRKFREELHANEIMLLAYYIAAVNIEDTYYGLLHGAEKALTGGGGGTPRRMRRFRGSSSPTRSICNATKRKRSKNASTERSSTPRRTRNGANASGTRRLRLSSAIPPIPSGRRAATTIIRTRSIPSSTSASRRPTRRRRTPRIRRVFTTVISRRSAGLRTASATEESSVLSPTARGSTILRWKGFANASPKSFRPFTSLI